MFKENLLKQNKILRYTVILISIGILMFGYDLYKRANPFVKYLQKQNTTEQGTIDIYNNNRKYFDNVYSYCKSANASVRIEKTNNKKFTVENTKDDSNSKVILKDNEIIEGINKILFTLNFQRITYYGNYAFFIRESFLDSASGIVYSIDGKEPNDSLIGFYKHIDGNWYYFSTGVSQNK